jgi:D-cysteine desulfhydrase
MKITFPESLSFSNVPTPITPLKSLWSAQSGVSIWIKRDDLTGLEVGGNKVRKLEFLLNEAVQYKITHVLTCGSFQSNHCRTTAFLAAKLGIKTVLFLKGLQQGIPNGNWLLNKLLQAEMVSVSAEEYERVDSLMTDRVADLNKQGKRGYSIPEGGSNHLGIWGYIRCFAEIMTQIRHQSLPIDTIIVASGSGGTHAGLLLGKILFASTLQVFSVNVCDTADLTREKIINIIDKFKDHYGYNFTCHRDDIRVIDGFVGKGYGLLGRDEIGLIAEFARQEGIILDPVYTSKAFLGLQHIIANGFLQSKNILFIHTGGIFSIFPYAADFTG